MRIRGFSLIEVMITFFLIVVMIVSIFSVFPQTRRGLAHSETRVNAAYVGRNLMDYQRSLGFDYLTPLTGSTTYKGTNNGAPFTQVFDYRVNIDTVDSDRKQVWVTVSWNDQAGTGHITIETMIVKL